jgi:hypothetical protein
MAQPLYRQLLQQARRLARLDPRRPQQGNLRGAISRAYYALFHFLIDQSSRLLIGSSGDRERLRMVMARAYGHGERAAAARTVRGGVLPATITRMTGPLTVPPVLRELAELFVDLQEQRHLADYDLVVRYSRTEALFFVDGVESIIQLWNTVRTHQAARLFLLALVVWERVRSR